MKTKLMTCASVATAILCLMTTTVTAVDLLARYPTQLTAGDTDPDHARSWEFTPADIYRVSQFVFKVGEGFRVETGAADLAIGHCTDGAVWAVLIPRAGGTLTSPVSGTGEAIANVWLRFHPGQINRLFPPDTVFADGNTNLTSEVLAIAKSKMTSSWQSSGKAMIPEPKYLTVFVDTTNGLHQFFDVDTAAQTAQYFTAFNRRSSGSQISAKSIPPVVVKTWPESGSTNVPPGEYEIKVTFSKEMKDQSWSWCDVWDKSTPESAGGPKYDADHRTCTMKVKLEPDKAYGYWINTENNRHFQDQEGHPAVPYLLTFKTRSSAGEPATQAAEAWLELIDGGNYSQSWQEASTVFQGGVTEAAWENSMNIYRQPLGALISRNLKSAQPMTQLPGAPDGQYVVMQFDTSFTDKKSAVETVTFMLESDGHWKSAGYFIK